MCSSCLLSLPPAFKWVCSVRVDYSNIFPYSIDPLTGRLLPILAFDLVNRQRRVTLNGCLDTGCERSLLDGRLALAVGIDLTGASSIPYCSAVGISVAGLLAPVNLVHPALGSFHLEVGFSPMHLARNLLGRDFLDLIQIGFREHRLEFYVLPSP